MKDPKKEARSAPCGPLGTCVRSVLERYFHDLGGEVPVDLYEMVITQIEAPLLEFTMERVQHNQCQAAKVLGINRNTLRKKLKLYGLCK